MFAYLSIHSFPCLQILSIYSLFIYPLMILFIYITISVRLSICLLPSFIFFFVCLSLFLYIFPYLSFFLLIRAASDLVDNFIHVRRNIYPFIHLSINFVLIFAHLYLFPRLFIHLLIRAHFLKSTEPLSSNDQRRTPVYHNIYPLLSVC